MRITNKIMQKNNLSNINTNKIYQDKLSTQMSTQKKINRPSDDPVVAIRALRLRSSVTEVTQYYSKNIPDAESWLSVTEDALKNLSAITTNMITLCTKGSNGPLKTEDRQIILEQLKKLGEEVYATGDADYAGRYVFTGYRTDTSLSFEKEQTIDYEITEQLNNKMIDTVSKVDIGNLMDLNSTNYTDADFKDIIEDDITSVEVHRIRLAYDDCKDIQVGADGKPLENANGNPAYNISVSFKKGRVDGDGNPIYGSDGKPIYDRVTWSAENGDIEVYHPYDTPGGSSDPYSYIAANPDKAVFIPETGELLLGEDRYAELMAVKDDDTTLADESEIQVTYEKDHWQKGDLRPEHYFACTANPDDPEKKIEYNMAYLVGNMERQDIEYDVGFNQTIRVNSTADQCFKHGIGREVDDILNAIQDVLELEEVQGRIQKLYDASEEGSEEHTTLKNQLDAIGKALTYAKNKEQKLFENGITAFQGYLDDANLCITECGTRSSKLALIENRMQNQKTTFETLKSENEDIDITEVAIQLTSAELTYEAALMATGKVSQTTLLNYI